MNEAQKDWLLKVESEFFQEFPGNPYEDEKTTERFLEKVEEIHKSANENETVRRWLLIIMRYFADRNAILTGNGKTQAEYAKELSDKYEEVVNR